ncbi:unnamed protein product [Caenorhabditis nigoni]
MSAVRNKPDNYILYQTLCIVVYKMISVLALVWGYLDFKKHHAEDVYGLIGALFAVDLLATPVFIQISYLLCNRRNVMLLKQQISMGKFKSWIMRNILRNNSVAPVNVYENDEVLGPSTIS